MMFKLKGKNQIRKFRRVAEDLALKISSLEGVSGIVFIRGLVRGFADKFSDCHSLYVSSFLHSYGELHR